jgi:uncharacterized protein (TIGR02145 family)
MHNQFKAQVTTIIIAILALIIAAGGGYIFLQSRSQKVVLETTTTTTPTITIQEPTTTTKVTTTTTTKPKITTTTTKSKTTTTTKKVKMFKCGDSITFTYKGSNVAYGTVYSPATGKCWLDRNLGASRVATAYNDSAAYGDLFQWGRLDDGHQTRTSVTTSTLSSTDNPGHSNFILAPKPLPYYDWHSPQNDSLWQGVSGINNPCPSGWRIPTYTELDNERASWSQQNYNGAFASPLKLTAGGIRINSNGSLSYVASYGLYWSSTLYGADAYYLDFNSGNAFMYDNGRSFGFSVRCLKD